MVSTMCTKRRNVMPSLSKRVPHLAAVLVRGTRLFALDLERNDHLHALRLSDLHRLSKSQALSDTRAFDLPPINHTSHFSKKSINRENDGHVLSPTES